MICAVDIFIDCAIVTATVSVQKRPIHNRPRS